MQRLKKIVFVIAIDGCLLIVVAVVVEAYLRWLRVPAYVRTYPGQHSNQSQPASWAEPDEYFGWISNRRQPDINLQGFRDRRNFDRVSVDSNTTRIMVLGDSFMWGAGSEASESVPRQLERILGDGFEVFNVSVPGWGVDQMYLAYEKYVSVLRPHVVILAYIDDDVFRVLEAYRANENLTKPSFAVVRGELVPVPYDQRQQRLSTTMAKSVLVSQLARSVVLFSVARPIVCTAFQKIASDAARRGARFVVVRIPNREQEWFFARFISQRSRFAGCVSKTTAVYLDALDDMKEMPNWQREFFVEDGHTSSAGNRFLSRWLLAKMRAFLPSQSPSMSSPSS